MPGRGRQRATAWAIRPHHLAERYQQLLLLALGETILSVGATFAVGRGRVSANEILGLLVAFLTSVLLWRIYFHRAGLLLGAAVAAARDRAQVGRFAGSVHVVMVGDCRRLGRAQHRPEPAAAAVVLFGISVADTRQAARRPAEKPNPADGEATWLGYRNHRRA